MLKMKNDHRCRTYEENDVGVADAVDMILLDVTSSEADMNACCLA